MFSIIQELGLEPPYYGIMVTLGITACSILLLFTRKKRDNIDGIELLLIAVAAFIGAFLMSRIFYAIAHYEKLVYIITHPQNLFADLKSFIFYITDIFGGMVFYGGLIGACVGSYIYIKKAKLNINNYSDILAPCIPLFHAFGRIGCFLAGCCYGIESKLGFIHQHPITPYANGVRRFPVQLLEAGENLLICAILLLLLYKCTRLGNGILIWIYGMVYPIIRFTNEFLRGDNMERGYFGMLSTSQWISIFIFILSTTAIIIKTIKNKKNKGA